MPNFKKLAKTYEEDALKALLELVRKPSVYDPASIDEEHPYGKGVRDALDFIAKLGKDYGFEVDTCDHRATELTAGEGSRLIGVYAHSDVVPASGKWDEPPFKGVIKEKDGKKALIARGATDDKGPLIASLFAIKLLKDNGLLKDFRVRLVTGGDEERGSSCLEYYFDKLKKPHCDYGFTPDADFPLIYAEKGIYRANISRKIDLSPIIGIDGGVANNAVCDKIVITLPTDKKLNKKLSEDKEIDISEVGEVTILNFKGKSAHGSTPELGLNAGLKAFRVLGEYYGIDYLVNLANKLDDPTGLGFDGNETSKELGKNTYNYGLFKYDSHKKNLSVSVDFRFGEEAHPDEDIEKMKKAISSDVEVISKSRLLIFDKKSTLVSTLMKSYKHMTHHFFDKPFAIGGGTYAKEAKNIVAYGGAFQGHPGNIHSPNEYLFLEDLYKSIAIYADAIYSLGKAK